MSIFFCNMFYKMFLRLQKLHNIKIYTIHIIIIIIITANNSRLVCDDCALEIKIKIVHW